MFCSSPIQISKQLSQPVNRKTRHPQNSADWSSVMVEYVLHLGVIQLNPGLNSTWSHQSTSNCCSLWQNSLLTIQIKKNRLVKKKPDDLGHFWA
jgi:hypothetical protein